MQELLKKKKQPQNTSEQQNQFHGLIILSDLPS